MAQSVPLLVVAHKTESVFSHKFLHFNSRRAIFKFWGKERDMGGQLKSFYISWFACNMRKTLFVCTVAAYSFSKSWQKCRISLSPDFELLLYLNQKLIGSHDIYQDSKLILCNGAFVSFLAEIKCILHVALPKWPINKPWTGSAK